MKMKRVFFFFAALGMLALAGALPSGFAQSAASAAVPTPTPTPVALQYDQITRMVMASATVPPPGSFDDTYRAIMKVVAAAPSPTPAPKRRGFSGFGGMLAKGMMKHGMPSMGNMSSMMATMRLGNLERFTFYKNWVRTDLPVQQTATIEKCSEHETIFLDLAKKTYRISKDADGCGQHGAPPTEPAMPGRSVNMAPGTATMTISGTSANLGPKRLEGYLTHGSQSTLSMATTQATGSCKNGSMGMKLTQYISGIRKWRAYCPLPRSAAGPPTSLQRAASQGGCRPHMVVKRGVSMANAMGQGKLLTFYRLMQMEGGASQGSGFGSLLERGNIRWLYKPEAEALFSVPPDFTKEQ